MLEQLEGSKAVARAVAMCRPEVICAYPISPQTHIVEALGAMVKDATLEHCEFINVESEFGAMSVLIGASATGARSYTATSSQGLLFMTEAVYNAAGLGLPMVMTLANRAIGAPINIWNDYSDAMAVRDSGWIQLFAESNQAAVDLHIQAFRLSEEISLPVMVCMDGYVLTHAIEPLDVPDQELVDRYLPPFIPRQLLDVEEPVSIGAMVGPEAFTEVRYLAHVKQLRALERIPEISQEFQELSGRKNGGLVRTYRIEDASTVVIAMGSIVGTIEDVVDELRRDGISIGLISITTFRPFPLDALRNAVGSPKRVVVVDRAFSVGMGSILATDIALTLAHHDIRLFTVVAGLGGRAVTGNSLKQCLNDAVEEKLEKLTFLDLDHGVVERELARMEQSKRSGPSAENILRDLGTTTAQATAAQPERQP